MNRFSLIEGRLYAAPIEINNTKIRAHTRGGGDFPRCFRDLSEGRFPQPLNVLQAEGKQSRFSALIPQIFRARSAKRPQTTRPKAGRISTCDFPSKNIFHRPGPSFAVRAE
ncbi:hypothetical protein GFM02_20790 [Rhizobium leguminosarum bv. viciae]|uniref:hypothetical protein n=1 Tax=Rhizobium leguminosarum TaxID=384 RepID=UPI00144182DA|nr:hypothetical protein [Rhizobium leguminosarum]NKL00638.1 hypothetical protein [Rhizobium leguminosarum bv. viciae]